MPNTNDMSANLTTIRNTAFEGLRPAIGEFSSRELRELCSELEIAGLSRGSKKACSKAVFGKEVAVRGLAAGKTAADFERGSRPAPKAPAPKAPAPKAPAPKAPEATSTKAPSTKAPSTKAPAPKAPEAASTKAPSTKAPAPKAPEAASTKAPKAKKAPAPKAPEAASTKAPKAKKAKKEKVQKPEPVPENRVDLPVQDIAESSYLAIEGLVEARDITFAAALDLLVKVGRSRLRATDKYYRDQIAAKEATKA